MRKMRKLVPSVLVNATLATAALAWISAAPAFAAGPGFALEKQDWTWQGIFGSYDKATLQRGLQVYREVCAACHGMKRIAFRNMAALGYNEAEIKTLAAEYFIVDGPDEEGEMFEREGKPSDRYPSPYPNPQAAMAANGGAYPPDLSLITKARVNGPDYLYNLLTRYLEEAPSDFELSEGKYYNEVFPGHQISMAPPLYDDTVEYADGTSPTLSQHAYDVTNFLMWAASPELEQRKSLGVKVILFLIVLTAMLYALKRKIWADVEH